STICPPWVFGGSAFVNGTAHTGINNATVVAFAPGTVQQTVTLPRPGVYQFSFWHSEFVAVGRTMPTSASVGGQTVFSQVVPAPGNPSYTQFTTQVTLAGGANTVLFSGDCLGLVPTQCIWRVDDVSLMLLQAFSLASLLPPGTPQNPQNVANGIDNFIN